MKKKWVPIDGERTIVTDKYKYIMGYYRHEKYGDRCFRVAKYLKANNYFIGHFIIVPEDHEAVVPALVATIEEGVTL